MAPHQLHLGEDGNRGDAVEGIWRCPRCGALSRQPTTISGVWHPCTAAARGRRTSRMLPVTDHAVPGAAEAS